MTANDPRVLPQWYAGVSFRSTLEARWAVFFTTAGIRWEYEPEGFLISGRPYRPDFLLPDCGTWVEVKGDPGRLDLDLMARAAVELPRVQPRHERGPALMLLGHVPAPPPGQQDSEDGDWGWVGLDAALPPGLDPGDEVILGGYYGFGCYDKNLRPWWLSQVDEPGASQHLSAIDGLATAEYALTPVWDVSEFGIPAAYAAARAQRFGRQS